MPILVHITDEKNSARITRSGIALGKHRRVIYCMPVVQDHLISHQWLRELRRGGARVLVGIYFRLSSSELVWAGRYNEPHKLMPLGQAIRELMALPDPLGYEMFVERKIGPDEITKIRHLPQKLGWRYRPHAHGSKPCGCPVCLLPGSVGVRKLRQKFDSQDPVPSYESLKTQIAESSDIWELLYCLQVIGTKRRRADPTFLERVMTLSEPKLLEALARTLVQFRHKNSQRMLLALCEHESEKVKKVAAESLFHIYRHDAAKVLGSLIVDPTIGKVLASKS